MCVYIHFPLPRHIHHAAIATLFPEGIRITIIATGTILVSDTSNL